MMISYEEIEQANSALRLTEIEHKQKGKVIVKQYAEVNQRIKAFRMLFPEGFITTEIKSLTDGVCVMVATVGYVDDEGQTHVLATGTAYEKEGSTFINSTSYIENCETSAIGRALGMCGIGIDTSVASFEEVSNAMLQQSDFDGRIAGIKVKALGEKCDAEGINIHSLCALYQVKSLDQLTEKMHQNIIANWEKVRERCQ